MLSCRTSGCVANLERKRERANCTVERSGGKQLELLGKRWLRIAGILPLMFAHYVNHLDPAQDHTGSGFRLKTEHGSHSPLDSTVILLIAIVEVGTLANPNGFHTVLRSVLEPVCGVARRDRLTIGLAAVDDNPLGPAVPPEGLS